MRTSSRWNRARAQAGGGTRSWVRAGSESGSTMMMVVTCGDAQSYGANLGDAKTQGAEGGTAVGWERCNQRRSLRGTLRRARLRCAR